MMQENVKIKIYVLAEPKWKEKKIHKNEPERKKVLTENSLVLEYFRKAMDE